MNKLEISLIKKDNELVKKKSRNPRIPGVNSQKSAIIVIKLIISKRTVEKKILSNTYRDLLINQIQISSQIQLTSAIKVDNSRN